MKSWIIAVLAVAAVLVGGVLVARVVFPEELNDVLPGWLRTPLPAGTELVLAFEPDESADLNEAAAQAVNVVKRRLEDLRVLIAITASQRRMVVQLNRRADVQRTIEVVTRRGRLQFRLIETSLTPEQAVRGEPPPHAEVLYGRADKAPYLVYKRSALTGRDLVDAQAAFDQRTNEPIVTFRFSANGTRRFAQITQENVGKPFAIVLDNEVISAPIIREPILQGSGQISGGFTAQEANDMAIQLRSGELPGKLTVIEQKAP
jgi:protein-export membrane protein SecD